MLRMRRPLTSLVRCRRPGFHRLRRVTDRAYPKPEDAALADDGIPADMTRVLAVMYSPRRDRALVFLEYNELRNVERYQVLCDRADEGWVAGVGTNGSDWLFTHHDPERGDVGIHTVGWDPPVVEWDVPSVAS
jgi:hypothetical protein